MKVAPVKGRREAYMDETTKRQLSERYKQGYAVVADAIAGATEAELDFSPGDGKWTIRQIVHHLADSEMTSAIRLRMLLAADRPSIVAYDQEEFARRLYYDDRPIAASLEAFRAARATSGEILDRMSDAEWQREGTHSEVGRYTVAKWLEIYAQHAHGHADQIRHARAAFRAPTA
jgi:hypothetical protein